MHNLLNSTTTGKISNCPSSFFLSLEVSLDQDVNEGLEDPSVNDDLDLSVVTSGDVRDGPGSFLKYRNINFKPLKIYQTSFYQKVCFPPRSSYQGCAQG
jgi:hypothetical protein